LEGSANLNFFQLSQDKNMFKVLLAVRMSDNPSSSEATATARAQANSLVDLERDETLALLYHISRELTSILSRDELFRGIAERIRKLVQYHLFHVMLLNPHTSLLETTFSVQHEETIPVRVSLPLNKGLTGYAAAERRSVRVDDVRLDPRYVLFPQSENVRSLLAIPLVLDERLIGVLDLESTRLNAFTLENERLLNILSSYIAIALENSRLYSESQESRARLQKDLDTAREVQRQLLPKSKREVPGLDISTVYVPARQLAGDFYDFLSYGSGRFALALGDVSGKGTAAALYASLAVGTLREYTQDHRCWPEEMLRVLNKRLCAAHMMPNYVALLFAVYDSNLRQLMLANAGEPRPILLRSGEVQEIQIDGTPLGMFEETEYDELTVALQPGDAMIFASDGILEATNSEDEHFGLERLTDVLKNLPAVATAEEINAEVITATDTFSGKPEEPHDDRTLIVLRVTQLTAHT
jgi:phosphoserine phosphatase RsbU/P